MDIDIINNPPQAILDYIGYEKWSMWEKEASTFPWTYEMNEVCYILEGEVTVTPEYGEPVFIQAGDLVNFPQGMSCEWEIHKDIKKHYQFTNNPVDIYNL